MKKVIISISVFVIIVFLLNKAPFLQTLKQSVLSFSYRIYEENILLPILYSKKIKEENKILKDSLDKLRFAYLSCLDKDFYIQELEKTIDIKDKKVRIAKIKYMQTPFIDKIFLIDFKQDDVKEDLYAFYSGFVLGKLNDNTIDLFSAPKKQTVAFLQNKNNKVKVVLTGLGGGRYKFEANKEFGIKKGDVIYFHNYPVALVVSKEGSDKSPYNIYYATVPFSIDLIETVNLHEI